MQVTTIGLDIAKNVFQVHGIDAAEKVTPAALVHACSAFSTAPRACQRDERGWNNPRSEHPSPGRRNFAGRDKGR